MCIFVRDSCYCGYGFNLLAQALQDLLELSKLDVTLQDRAELPGKSRSNMQAIHVLADEVLKIAGPLQSQEGHVS